MRSLVVIALMLALSGCAREAICTERATGKNYRGLTPTTINQTTKSWEVYDQNSIHYTQINKTNSKDWECRVRGRYGG